MNAAFDRLARNSTKLDAGSKPHAPAQDSARPYYGKCQYKTGKCFNERTLKRNGEVHSLCEEHRIKQNLIQRRSDRKYQTVHAIRRRERSQRRAVLKKQVSMAVAQQLFYEHQQQKTLGLQQLTDAHASTHSHAHSHTPSASHSHTLPQLANVAPLSLPPPFPAPFLSSAEGLASPILSFTTPSAFAEREDAGDVPIKQELATESKPDDATPTGIDDFTPDAFLNLCCSTEEGDAASQASHVPILSARTERELWSEDDIEFLQTLLLA